MFVDQSPTIAFPVFDLVLTWRRNGYGRDGTPDKYEKREVDSLAGLAGLHARLAVARDTPYRAATGDG